MIERYPSPRSRLFEQQYNGVVRAVRDLAAPRHRFDLDADGRFRIGDVYLIQSLNDDGSITLSFQNALTEGAPLRLGVLE